MNAFNNNFTNFNNQGYNTGAAMTGAPMGYGQQTAKTPLMTNPLTDEDRKLLAEKVDQFDLNVTREELAYAICTHKRDGKYDIVPANDGTGDVICKTCHARFNPNLVTPEYVQDAVDRILNVLQTLKYIGVDLNIDVIKQYFAMIPYLQRVPKLYKLENHVFNKYQEASPVQPTNTPNIFGAFNMMTNPAVPMGGYGMYGQYGAPMGQAVQSPFMAQQAQMMGQQNPLYQQSAQQQTQAGSVPASEVQNMINQAVADAMKQNGGQAQAKPADVTIKEKLSL